MQAAWNLAFAAGKEARRKGRGLEGWNTLSQDLELDKKADPIARWIYQPPVLGISFEHGDGLDSNQLDEYQHFNDQVARMPRSEPANKARICQVAYNLGQLYQLGDTRHSSQMSEYVSL